MAEARKIYEEKTVRIREIQAIKVELTLDRVE